MKYFPTHSKSIAAALDAIEGRKVVVLGHLRPDGDCIGSQVALCRVLRARGLDAVAVNGDPVPRNLASFIGDTPLVQPAELSADERLAITVDCADHGRVGAILSERYPVIDLCVDHHVSNAGFARVNVIDAAAAAAAEILAGVFLDLGLPIDAVTAQALYVGIATDTGQFQFPSTSPRVFDIAGELLARGADPGAASLELYEKESVGKIRLLQSFLSSLKLEMNGAACVGFLTDESYASSGATGEESEGLVDYARCIDGVCIGALIEERGGRIKGSLRAKDPAMRVDQLAALYGGGGHACAAGFNLDGTIDSFYPGFKDALARHLG